MKRILSIDGGGIRGIIPASVLVALEQQVGKPVRECFDFVAGTSTGALLATALAAGAPAQSVLDLYTQRCGEIFKPPAFVANAKRLIDGYMYDPADIRNVMSGVLGAAAAWTVNDSPIRLLLSAKGIDGHAWYFVRDNPKNSQKTGKLKLLDCAVASASAPTYFSPWTMNVDGTPTVMVDGSVGVTGDPVYLACVEAFYYDDGFTPDNTRVISLGTGFGPASNAVPSGLLGWLNWTVGALIDAPQKQQQELMKRHFPGIMQRFDWPLPTAIDLADTSSVPALVAVGQQAAAGMDWKTILG